MVYKDYTEKVKWIMSKLYYTPAIMYVVEMWGIKKMNLSRLQAGLLR